MLTESDTKELKLNDKMKPADHIYQTTATRTDHLPREIQITRKQYKRRKIRRISSVTSAKLRIQTRSNTPPSQDSSPTTSIGNDPRYERKPFQIKQKEDTENEESQERRDQ